MSRDRQQAPSRPDWLPEMLFPFQSRYLSVGEATIHYVDEGNGPPLLMLHGNPTYSFLYRNIIHALRANFRCISLDYPGMGLSHAPDGYTFTPAEHAAVVEKFLLALDLQDVILLAQDWGGPIGLTVALSHPDRFAGLVLGNTFARPTQPKTMHMVFARIMRTWVVKQLILTFNAFIPLMYIGTSRTRPSADVMDAYYGPYPNRTSRWPTYIFPRELLDSHQFLADLEAQLPRLAYHPALLAWGNRDILLNRHARQHLESVFHRHHTVILKGANHFIQEDAPTELAATILNWWAIVSG